MSRLIHVRVGGLGLSYQNVGLSAETVFIATNPPLVLYQGNTFGGTLGTAAVVSAWYQIPDDIKFPATLTGYRGSIEISGQLIYSSFVDIELKLQVPDGDGTFQDAITFKRNVSCDGWKLGTFKADFGLQVATSIAGERIFKLCKESLTP